MDDSPRTGRRYFLEILLISFAALLLEIAYTRVVSFKLFYYWVYLVIGLALLGIGSGAVFVAVSERLRRASTEAILRWGCLLGAVSVFVGYVVVATIRIDTLAIWDYGTRGSVTNLARLVAICLALYASFLPIGIMIATLFGRRTEHIGRLYFYDLLGAGLACAVVVPLLAWISPPATIALAGLVLGLTAVRLAWGRGRLPIALAGALVVLLASMTIAPGLLPEQRTDAIKSDLTADNTRYSSWSPVFRVDVVDALAVEDGDLVVDDDVRILYHDGLLGSAIYRFDGDVDGLDRFDVDPRQFPFAALGRDAGNVMIIGAAGGNEILASLYFDAGHVDAIELNPVTHHLVTDEFADYSGRLAEDPRVDYRWGDGRSFLARSDDDYDIIWFPAPDSYSATNAATAGAFVLSESYLYTSETVTESLDRLQGDGILAVQYGEFDYEAKPNRTARYVATARVALEDRGIDDPTDHVLVATTPAPGAGGSLSTVLVREDPFTDAQIDGFIAAIDQVEGGELRYAPGRDVRANAVAELVTTPVDELDRFLADYRYAIGPISDDGPFFWHFSPFRDVIRDLGEPVDSVDFEVQTGERVLLLLLAVAALLAVTFLLLPFVTIRRRFAALPHKALSVVYFACLGFGFLFFEITLIQRLTLFLGYPTYSLTVTLASILIFTGVGALLSGRRRHPPGPTVIVLFTVIAALTAFYGLALPELTDAFLTWPTPARIAFAFLVLGPLGICLGTFMPVGLRAVSELTDDGDTYVAWGWAVNGFASVIGAVLTTVLAMSFGFGAVLVIALGVYTVALAVLYPLLRASPYAAGPG